MSPNGGRRTKMSPMALTALMGSFGMFDALDRTMLDPDGGPDCPICYRSRQHNGKECFYCKIKVAKFKQKRDKFLEKRAKEKLQAQLKAEEKS